LDLFIWDLPPHSQVPLSLSGVFHLIVLLSFFFLRLFLIGYEDDFFFVRTGRLLFFLLTLFFFPVLLTYLQFLWRPAFFSFIVSL